MEDTRATHPLNAPAEGIHLDAGTGVLCALFSLFFGTAIAALIEKLQALLEAWRNGTLPPIPEPSPRAPRKSTQRHRTTAVRRTPRRASPPTGAERPTWVRVARAPRVLSPIITLHPKPGRPFFVNSQRQRVLLL